MSENHCVARANALTCGPEIQTEVVRLTGGSKALAGDTVQVNLSNKQSVYELDHSHHSAYRATSHESGRIAALGDDSERAQLIVEQNSEMRAWSQ